MDKTSLIAINKWMFFVFNFSGDFIDKVWADNPSLVNHLKSKFNSLYNHYGSYGVIPAFYGELDMNNRMKMMQWVMDNYNDEQKLKFND